MSSPLRDGDPGEQTPSKGVKRQRSLSQMFGVQTSPSPMKSPEIVRLEERAAANDVVVERVQKRAGPVQKRAGPGRLRKDVEDCRSAAANPLVKSNRLQPGMKRERWDPSPYEGLSIMQKYEELVQETGLDHEEALAGLKKT